MIGCVGKIIRPILLIMQKMSEYVITFKVKDGDKDKRNKKKKNIKLFRLRLKTLWN